MLICSGGTPIYSDSFPQLRDGHSEDAVILFHGMTGTPREMEELANALYSSGFHCFAPRLSGHDSSIKELSETSLSSWIADAKRVFDATEQYQRVHVIGQSFGSLLALHLAVEYPQRISSAVFLSLPWRFNSRLKELLLGLLSLLPDSMLNSLGYRKKVHRDGVRFRKARHAYSSHSLGAAARVIQLRSILANKLHKLNCPVLLLHDPLDHHLGVESVWQFRKSALGSAVVSSRWMFGGYHELTLGPCFEQIVKILPTFLRKGELDAS